MKVAIVQERIDVHRGGAETSTLEMARHLAALGLDVTVVYSRSDEATERRSHEGARKSHEATEPRSHAGSHGKGLKSHYVPPTGWPTASAVRDANARAMRAAEGDALSGVSFHFVETGRGSRARKAMRFVAEADRYCQQQGFDIVHAVTPCFSCNVYQPRGGTYVETISRSVARARTPLGKLVKRIGRRFNRRQRFRLLVERELLSGPEPPFVAAVSEYVARQVQTAFPAYPSDRLRVIFNGVEIEPPSPEEVPRCRAAVRRELDLDGRTLLVLFVAHNFKLKGLGELIRALSTYRRSIQSPTVERVGDPRSEPGAQATGPYSDGATKRRSDEGAGDLDWILVVVGRDKPGRYRRLARRLGVAQRVRFLGSRDDIRQLYVAADVLAHPTWYDPCSRVVLEALSCGLPVVTTRFNGAAEVIEDGRHGVVIDSPRDAAALAGAIAICLRSEVREACRSAAPEMRERLSMARHARELKAVQEAAARKT